MQPLRSPEEEDLLNIAPEDKERERKAQEEADARASIRIHELRRLMKQEWFRAWMWDLLTATSAFETIHAASPTGMPDPAASSYMLGRRSVGWDLWCMLDDLAPEQASLMRREARPPVVKDKE